MGLGIVSGRGIFKGGRGDEGWRHENGDLPPFLEMTFKFGSWNVNSRDLKGGHVDLLRRVDCDVLVLQEATKDFHAELTALPLFEWSVSSLTLRPAKPKEKRARHLGCSIFVAGKRGQATLVAAQ